MVRGRDKIRVKGMKKIGAPPLYVGFLFHSFLAFTDNTVMDK